MLNHFGLFDRRFIFRLALVVKNFSRSIKELIFVPGHGQRGGQGRNGFNRLPRVPGDDGDEDQ